MALVRIRSRLPLASVTVAVTRSRNLHDSVSLVLLRSGPRQLATEHVAHQREQTNSARSMHGVSERVVAGFDISCTRQLRKTGKTAKG